MLSQIFLSNFGELQNVFRQSMSESFVKNVASGLGVSVSINNPSMITGIADGRMKPALIDTATGIIFDNLSSIERILKQE